MSIKLDDLPLGDLLLWLNDNQLPDAGTFLLPGSVGQTTIKPEAWNDLTLASSWANFSSDWASAQYALDSLGFVHIRGLIANAAGWSSPIATLPVGVRPALDELFIGFGSDTGAGSVAVRIDVLSDGSIEPTTSTPAVTGDATYLSLSGITFKAAS